MSTHLFPSCASVASNAATLARLAPRYRALTRAAQQEIRAFLQKNPKFQQQYASYLK
jgi:hypothetical protein